MSVQALISAVESASSALELLRATAALARSADAAAAPTLVAVLGFNNPGAAVAAVDGLVAIGSPAVEPLLQLDPRNYGARAWAVRALAGIGDVRGLDLLIEALLTDVGPSVRRAAAKGLDNLQLAALKVGERAAMAPERR
jgi:phycocyanobilin lyase beta subunit